MENITKEKSVLDEIGKILTCEEPLKLSTNDSTFSKEHQKLIDEARRLKMENYDLNCAFESAADSIHVTDGQGTVLRVNSIFEKSMGVKREDIVGKNVRDAEADQLYTPSVVRLCIHERRKLTMIQRTPKTGSDYDAITTSVPIFDDEGNIFRVISNARPIKYFSLVNDYFSNMQKDTTKNNDGIPLTSKDPQMRDLVSMAKHISQVSSGVLITGESGTGKSLLAKFIHENSGRKPFHFVELNCAAIPESLMESELFGYEAGAFTGAKTAGKQGLIEFAHQGTLFLDEIGDMPLSLQAKLLQVLQYKKITRVGGSEEIAVDIRIISATNRDLIQMIKKGAFRNDLYYRLNIIPFNIPPLRQRKIDIKPLTEQFVKKFNHANQKEVLVSKEVYTHFLKYSWPGNIRELENLIERLVAVNRDGYITEGDLPDNIRHGGLALELCKAQESRSSLSEILDEVERQIISEAYRKYESSYKVAEALGISQSGANRKIMKYLGKRKLPERGR